jgi:hypothetical protein
MIFRSIHQNICIFAFAPDFRHLATYGSTSGAPLRAIYLSFYR